MEKKQTRLNKAGIRLLADDLVANKKLYDQNTFGDLEDCGTVCCLAGFCYRRVIGIREFNRLAKKEEMDNDACLKAGKKQLGIVLPWSIPKIFESIGYWPDDLETEYCENGPLGRVIVALKALQRLKPNGSVDRNRKAVHTRLPQLRLLLAEQKAVLARQERSAR